MTCHLYTLELFLLSYMERYLFRVKLCPNAYLDYP
jgi:hypothetical protein